MDQLLQADNPPTVLFRLKRADCYKFAQKEQ